MISALKRICDPEICALRVRESYDEAAGIVNSIFAQNTPSPSISGIKKISYDNIKNLDIIGSGGCCLVYLGQCGQNDVAVKMIRPENLNEEATRKLLKEAHILKGLSHKNIVKFDGIIVGLAPRLVFEYLERGDLYALIEAKKLCETPLLKRLSYAIDILDGLNYLHTKRILHLDVKSLNILVTNDFTMKIADFGSSIVLRDSDFVKARCPGTAKWMAPEIIKGHSFSYPADVFSIGVVCWELVELKIPFDGMSVKEIKALVFQEGGTKELSFSETTAKKIVDVIRPCWRADPNERPKIPVLKEGLFELVKSYV